LFKKIADPGKEMRYTTHILALGLALASGPAASAEWTTFVEPKFGTTLQIPSEVFSVHQGKSYRGIGEQYTTKDRRAALAVYSQENSRKETPRTYLKRNNSVPRRMIEYVRVTPSFFAISTAMKGTIFYSRCNFSPRTSAIHCFDLKYPASEKQAWDDIVTRISLSLEPLERG
jgi:hypothetical protein